MRKEKKVIYMLQVYCEYTILHDMLWGIAFPVKLASWLYQRTSLTTKQHWIMWSIGAVRQRTLTWTTVNLFLSHHIVSVADSHLHLWLYNNGNCDNNDDNNYNDNHNDANDTSINNSNNDNDNNNNNNNNNNNINDNNDNNNIINNNNK